MRITLLCLALSVAAQPQQQFADIGDLPLVSGETLRNCRVGYRVVGSLNAERSNAVLFPTWFGGRSQDLVRFAAQDALVDPSRLAVILVDALANGVSSSPSNTPDAYPKVTIADMVESQRRLLAKLGIPRLAAVIGISMGGMQTFEWMTASPTMMDRAIPIIGSPRLATPDLLLWNAELMPIEAAQASKADLRAAYKASLAMHQFAVETPFLVARRTPPSDFQALQATIEKSARDGMHPLDWAAQLRAMIGHDVTRNGTMAAAAAKVRARTLIVVATQDHMVNPAPAIEFAAIGGFPLLKLEGDCGHLAIGCEAGKLNAAVQKFLLD